ncbi:MAG: hypothetical protein WAK17_11180 [Candidatus Nitrosopolaris sp.]|jgi:hypothetical protein
MFLEIYNPKPVPQKDLLVSSCYMLLRDFYATALIASTPGWIMEKPTAAVGDIVDITPEEKTSCGTYIDR